MAPFNLHGLHGRRIDLARDHEATGQHPLQVDPDAIRLGQGKRVTVFLGAAVVELLDDIDHQGIAREVAIVVVDGPVNVEEPQTQIPAVFVDEPGLGALVMQAQVVVTGIGNIAPTAYAGDVGIAGKLPGSVKLHSHL